MTGVLVSTAALLGYNAEDKTVWSYTVTSQYVFMAWCLIKQDKVLMAWCLVKHRDKFTF
jgi:hypothetical protein